VRLYRIAKTSHIRELDGAGARFFGGRWNHKGTSMIYTSEGRALASLEYFVHLPMVLEPHDLSIATFVIPDSASIRQVDAGSLSKGWETYPAPIKLADIGSEWARSGDSLLLRVPSAVVQDEYNVLINPEHAEMSAVEIEGIRTYVFDARLLKRIKREA
jgi:RES domain-containing protein